MVLLRIRVYPEPVRSRKLCTNGRSFLVIVSRPGYRLDNASIFFLTPIAHLSILFIYQNGLHGKIMNKRYGIPLHSIVLLALLLAAGGFARVFPMHPTNGVGPFQCARNTSSLSSYRRYALRVPTRMLHPSSQKLRRRTRAHIWRRPPLPLFLL